jgi:F-type H+-transporting ATPase subunit b
MRFLSEHDLTIFVPQEGAKPAVEKTTAETAAPAAGHGGHGGGGFNPLEPSFGLVFWGLIVFALLLALMNKFAWGPITKMVEDREKRIQADLEGAEKSRIDADRTLADYKRKLDEAAIEAKAKVEEAVARAEKQGAELFAQRKAEADALIDKAKKQIEAERDKALSEVRQTAVEVAFEITRAVVRRTASQEDLSKIADEVVPKFKKVV